MQDYEKLGAFYLGRRFDLAGNRVVSDEPLLYDAKDLTTHAVIVGMTGSGKTGLATALIEEAAIDGVPVIAIDPKGDLGNLLLTFPALDAASFAPWIDPAEAARHGNTPEAEAQAVAERWRKGLAEWGQPPERVARPDKPTVSIQAVTIQGLPERRDRPELPTVQSAPVNVQPAPRSGLPPRDKPQR